ncbi:DUF4167 domain-containing protein [Rhodobacter sp. SY28-1]|uniref:DUF4167 domain-containing protein n=1 Tax=Rhodobacter sp. SY28-1 TaxID=2562317 RepID=UPI0010C138EC|nr:DUF4167 domain-containing protein [Rhodobacter sp. SY28-1]
MRSSKKRSRSNQNRPRTLGNIVNRVFDSSGPEGKVRGTPQQIIEKYQMLARDAQLSNDRVAAENFLQHAEHYTRMLAEAMKEMAAEQEARQQQYQQNGGQNGNQNGGQGGQGGQHGQQGGQQGQPRGDRQDRGERGDRNDRGDRGERRDYNRDFRAERDLGSEDQPVIADVIDLEAGDDTGLIETPESGARPRTEPEPEPVAEAAPREAGPREDRPARRPRGPRKPKGEGKSDGEPPQEAAE